MLQIPLIKYLKDIARTYGGAKYMYVTKTMGGRVWLSNEAPGDTEGEGTYYTNIITKEKEYISKNYIEFNDSDFSMRLPRDVYQQFDLKPGSYKRLDKILKELKEKEID